MRITCFALLICFAVSFGAHAQSSVTLCARDVPLTELLRVGDNFRSEKRHLEAIDCYRSALTRSTAPQADVYNRIGIASLSLGRWVDAERAFGKAVALDRSNAGQRGDAR